MTGAKADLIAWGVSRFLLAHIVRGTHIGVIVNKRKEVVECLIVICRTRQKI